MTQCVWRHTLGNLGHVGRGVAGARELARRHRVGRILARELREAPWMTSWVKLTSSSDHDPLAQPIPNQLSDAQYFSMLGRGVAFSRKPQFGG
jgi:hypothetical protein